MLFPYPKHLFKTIESKARHTYLYKNQILKHFLDFDKVGSLNTYIIHLMCHTLSQFMWGNKCDSLFFPKPHGLLGKNKTTKKPRKNPRSMQF